MSTGAPPSDSIINLAIADLAIYGVLFAPTVWITWKHGKTGMVVWPIFISYFALRFVTDVYQILKRHDVLEYNTVTSMTNAGSLACLALVLIGLVYEANMVLPLPPRSLTQKIILAVTHLANTAGIGMATYASAPSKTNIGETVNPSLNRIGNCLMLFVIFTVCGWIYPSYRRLVSVPTHPNYRAARWLLVAAAAGLPFQLIRMAYNTTYAFNRIPSLDPITGSFLTRFFLLFVPQLGVAIPAVIFGWLSMNVIPRQHLEECHRVLQPSCDDSTMSEMPLESRSRHTE